MNAFLEQFSAQQRKSLAFGVLVALIVLGVGCTVLPAVLLYTDNAANIARLSQQLETFQAVAMTKDNYVLQMQRLRRAQPGRKFYLTSKTANVASSELTNLIQKVVRRQRIEVQSTRDIKVKDKHQAASVSKVAVQVVLRGNINALQAVLYDLEMRKPFLFIERTYVRSRAVRRSRKAKAVKGELDIQLVVAGYIRKIGGE